MDGTVQLAVAWAAVQVAPRASNHFQVSIVRAWSARRVSTLITMMGGVSGVLGAVCSAWSGRATSSVNWEKGTAVLPPTSVVKRATPAQSSESRTATKGPAAGW